MDNASFLAASVALRGHSNECASRDTSAVVVWAVAPLFAAAILLGVLFFFAHRAGRRAVNDLEFKLEHPPTAAVQVVAPPPAADVELVSP